MSAAISVIVPVYDGARFLPLAFRSLRRQTLAPLEVVVVDDGSRDGSGDVAASLATGCPFPVEVVRKPNGGLSSAMNAGLRRSRGDWVLELDADDFLAPRALERFAAHVRDGVDVVASEFFHFSWRGPAPMRRLSARRIRWPLPPTEEFLRQNTVICTSLARRSRVEACGGWEERLTAHQDWDLWLRLWTGTNFVRVPEPLVWVYRHPGSMSADPGRMTRHREMVRDHWRTRYAGVAPERL